MSGKSGGLNWSMQHFNLQEEMECFEGSIVAGFTIRPNSVPRFEIPLGDASIACWQWMAARGIDEVDWTGL
jgi:hypothetical protein